VWGGGGGGGGVQPLWYSHASAEMPRVAADASYLALGIVQKATRPKFFAAPPRIACLLEGQFYIDGLSSSCALWRAY
jgi:hypothetical protein